MCHVLPECFVISSSTRQAHYAYQTADDTDAQRKVMLAHGHSQGAQLSGSPGPALSPFAAVGLSGQPPFPHSLCGPQAKSPGGGDTIFPWSLQCHVAFPLLGRTSGWGVQSGTMWWGWH